MKVILLIVVKIFTPVGMLVCMWNQAS